MGHNTTTTAAGATPALLLALMLGLGAAAPEPAQAARAPGGDREGAAPTAASQAARTPPGGLLRPGRLGAARAAIADLDRDGLVTAGEAAAYFRLRFSFMDRDGDGALDAAEFIRGGFGPDRRAKDAPIRRGRAPEFAALDLDGDGRLSREEFLLAQLRARAQGLGAREARRRRAALFRAVDADGDGLASRDEFIAAGTAHFTGRDGDGDGAVTVWEFRVDSGF